MIQTLKEQAREWIVENARRPHNKACDSNTFTIPHIRIFSKNKKQIKKYARNQFLLSKDLRQEIKNVLKNECGISLLEDRHLHFSRVYYFPDWMLKKSKRQKKIKINFKPESWLEINKKELEDLISKSNNMEIIFYGNRMLQVCNSFDNKFPYKIKKEKCSTGRMKSIAVNGLTIEGIPKEIRKTIFKGMNEYDICKFNLSTSFKILKHFKIKHSTTKEILRKANQEGLSQEEKKLLNSITCGKKPTEEEHKIYPYIFKFYWEIKGVHKLIINKLLKSSKNKIYFINACGEAIKKDEKLTEIYSHFFQGLEVKAYKEMLGKFKNNGIYLYDALITRSNLKVKRIKIKEYNIIFSYNIKKQTYNSALYDKTGEKDAGGVSVASNKHRSIKPFTTKKNKKIQEKFSFDWSLDKIQSELDEIKNILRPLKEQYGRLNYAPSEIKDDWRALNAVYSSLYRRRRHLNLNTI